MPRTLPSAFNNRGAGIYFVNGSHPDFTNTIFRHDSPNQIRPGDNTGSCMESGCPNTLHLEFSNIQGETPFIYNSSANYLDNETHIEYTTLDPLFWAPIPSGGITAPFSWNTENSTGVFDYSLQPQSPCLNTGSPSFIDPDDTISDKGAFYYEFIVGCMDDAAPEYDAAATLACNEEIGEFCTDINQNQPGDNCCCGYEYNEWYVCNPEMNVDILCEGVDTNTFESIQEAVDDCGVGDGDIIWVAPGLTNQDTAIYFENVTVRKSVNIYSHYMMDGDESFIGRTVIDGSIGNNINYPDIYKSCVAFLEPLRDSECDDDGRNDRSGSQGSLIGFTLQGGAGTRVWDYTDNDESVLEDIEENCEIYDADDLENCLTAHTANHIETNMGSAVFINIGSPIINYNHFKNNLMDIPGSKGALCAAGTGADIPDPQPKLPPDEEENDERSVLNFSHNIFEGNEAEVANSVMVLGRQGIVDLSYSTLDYVHVGDEDDLTDNGVSTIWCSTDGKSSFNLTGTINIPGNNVIEEDICLGSDCPGVRSCDNLNDCLKKVYADESTPVTIELRDNIVSDITFPIQMADYITLEGSIFESEDGRNEELTTLDPGDSHQGIIGYNLKQAVLKNLKVTNGLGDNGGGISLIGASLVTLDNIEINSCSYAKMGGGLYISNSKDSIKILNTKIYNNNAISGSGIYITNSPIITIENTIIENNQNSGISPNNKGAGIFIKGNDSPGEQIVLISNSEIRGNKALTAPAVFSHYAKVKLQNVLISGNYFLFNGGGEEVYPGGAVYSNHSELSIINCTITGNSYSTGDGNSGGIYLINNPYTKTSIVNSIIWGNEGEQLKLVGDNSVDILYSILQGGTPALSSDNAVSQTINQGLENYNEYIYDDDPYFVNGIGILDFPQSGGDFNLTDTSIYAIDMGILSFYTEESFLHFEIGLVDFNGNGPDLGSFESPFIPLCEDELACNYPSYCEPGDSCPNDDNNGCIYPETGWYNCSGDCIANIDCNGECGGIAEVDECGVCGGDNSTCNGGCMEEEADNYDEDAAIDDGSCLYNMPIWVDCPSCYENTASMTAIVLDALSGDQVYDENDILAAFDAEGNVRGIALHLYPIPFGPYEGTGLYEMQIRGDAAGDAISFKYYDASEDEVLDSGTGYTFVIDDIIGDVMTPHEIFVGAVTLSIDIASGWNWFSLNVEGDMNIVSVMASLTSTEGDFIKSANASATFYATCECWYGGLEVLGVAGMYKFSSANADLLVFTGAPVNPLSTPIALESGWNWLGFTPQNDGPTEDALATITTTDGDFIKNQGASSTYYDAAGTWYGGLEVMAPTEGYMLSVAEESVLTYPNFGADDALTREKSEKELPIAVSHWGIDYHDYEFNGHITMSIDSREDSDGDYIAVFAGEECRGLAERMYFPFGDSYMYSVMVYSNKTDGEELTFRYYDKTNDEVIEYSETLTFENNMIVGDGFNTFGLSREVLPIPKEFSLERAYPNPFNPVTTIQYGLPVDAAVNIIIYDLQGRIAAELVSGMKPAGYYTLKWDASDHASGIYFVKMMTEEFTKTQKLMLVK